MPFFELTKLIKISGNLKIIKKLQKFFFFKKCYFYVICSMIFYHLNYAIKFVLLFCFFNLSKCAVVNFTDERRIYYRYLF